MYLGALGAEYVVVHGKDSREYYRDFLRPERLAGLTPVLRVEDDAVYALPSQPIAHVMREEEVVRDEAKEHPEMVERYVSGIVDSSRPALGVRWESASSMAITGAPAGSLVSVQVNADPGWQAQGASIERDGLGFIVARAGGGPIKLRYRGTAEQRVMASLSVLAWVGAIVMCRRRG